MCYSGICRYEGYMGDCILPAGSSCLGQDHMGGLLIASFLNITKQQIIPTKMAKKKVVYQETYKKNAVRLGKEQIIDMINLPETELFALKGGRYEDGREFLTITIDNIDVSKLDNGD